MRRNLDDLEDFMAVLKEEGIREVHYAVESKAEKEKPENVIAVLQLTSMHPEKEKYYYLHRTVLFNGVVQNTDEARKNYFGQIQSGTDNVIKEFQRVLPACRIFKGWITNEV